jgi:maleate isomerase
MDKQEIQSAHQFNRFVAWRHRIGLIVPSTNTVCEMDFHRLVPQEISVHTGRMMLLGEISGDADWKKSMDWEEIHERMHEECGSVAREIATAQVDIMVFGCTSGSFIKGPGFDKEVSRRIEEAVSPICGKIPVVTTSTAVVEALKWLKIEKVSVATPYIEKGNEQERSFLEGVGFRVVDIKGLGIDTFGDYARQGPQVIYSLAREVDKKDADGIFISCADFRALDVIDVLEKDLKKPVVSSNQASIWLTLRKIGVQEKIKRHGLLLSGDI